MSISRRVALGLPGLLLLPACTQIASLINQAPSLNTASLTNLTTDAKTIADGVLVLVPLVQATGQLSGADAANVKQAAASLNDAAAAIAASTDLKAAPTVNSVKAFALAVNTIVLIASSIPVIPEQYRVGLQAAAALLPVLEAAVGITAADQHTATMPEAAARLIITRWAVQRKA